MFNNQPIYCPECLPCPHTSNREGVQLKLVERNYSGCGVDIASCPMCKKCFQVSYKVNEITEVKGW
jgi:hypothetical protein